ncbi:MAG TPA: tRNA lysidine(34) synthetase TilS, partial [Blastocatellia bacterium]|nr:tRNA lysidine(34) synthetase TilS [Blastocatellia bacterium]
AAFIRQPEGLRRRMIIEAIRRVRPLADAADAEVGSAHVIAVEGLLAESLSGSRVSLPGGLEVWREFDALVFKPSQMRGESLCEQELSRRNPRVEMAGVEIVLAHDLPGELREESMQEALRERDRQGRDWLMAVLDDEKLPEALVVRPRRAGERAQGLGGRKIKKLKKLMIDHRIPTSRRALWPVVATPDGRYVWSPGLPPAVDFAASDQTRRLAILRASGI